MYYPVRGIGTIGVLSDLSPYEVPANGWTEAENVRIDDMAIRRDRGYRTELDLTPQGSPPVHHRGWWHKDGTTWAIALEDGRWFRYDGTAVANISPAGGFQTGDPQGRSYSGGVWYSDIIGNWLITTNKISAPHAMLNTDTELAPLTNWPVNYLAGQIVPFQSFLFAVDLSKDGSDISSTVKWSDVMAPDDLTPPDWTIAEGSLAGETVLDDEGGGVFAAKVLGQSLILYGLHVVWRVDPSGNPDSPWTFRRIFSDEGAISPRSVCDMHGMHLVVGPRTIYMHAGTPTKTRIAEDKVESQFYNELGDGQRVQAAAARNEAFIVYTRDQAQAGPYQSLDRALVWNSHRNQFTWVDMPEVAHVEIAPLFGRVLTWADLTMPWYEITWSWDEMTEPPTDGILVMSGRDDSKLYAKDEQASRDGASVPVYLANRYMDLDALLEEHTERPRQIRGILPQFKGTGTVQFRIGTSDQPGGMVDWGTPVDFVIGKDYKLDFRQTGRYLSLELINNEVSSDWWLTGYDIDVELRGRR